MINLLKKVWLPITIIGTILVAYLFFLPTTPDLPYNYTVVRLETRQIGSYTWNYYSFDTYLYLKNLGTQLKPDYLSNIFTNGVPEIPKLPDWTDILSILKFLANCFIWIPNLLILLVNYTILAPLQLLMYPINIIMTLIGINTTNTDFVMVTQKIINFHIEYIQYI